MSGIHTGVVRFQDLKRGLAAVEIEATVSARSTFAVLELMSGAADVGDELVGNLEKAGRVDLFNRTKRDHVQATVQLASVTRDSAVAHMKT